MKTGRTVHDLAVEINRQQKVKRDFMVPAPKIHAFAHNDHLELGFPTDTEDIVMPLNDNGHVQLGQYCDIPKKYYDLMKGHPGLLATNVKHWLERSSDRRLIRTLDGNVRAFLSDTYRRLDNYDLAQHVLPMLNEAEAQVMSCEITDKKLYIKAVTHKVQGEVKKGDVVSAGVIVSNSEVGHGSLSVKPYILRLVCMNGATADKLASRKYHSGKKNDDFDQIEFSNDTMAAEDTALWLKVRDLVKHSLSLVTFRKVVESMKEATERTIAEPMKAIELVSSSFTFNDTEKGDVIKHLIEGGDLTSWGLGNAVTRASQDVGSYDRATELESIGYQIMTRSWN